MLGFLQTKTKWKHFLNAIILALKKRKKRFQNEMKKIDINHKPVDQTSNLGQKLVYFLFDLHNPFLIS